MELGNEGGVSEMAARLTGVVVPGLAAVWALLKILVFAEVTDT